MLDRTSYLANRIFVAYDCDLNTYYQDAKEIDIGSIRADAIIIDDIPCDEDLSVPPAPPESLKGSDIDWE